jgi:hypothetical protein
MRVWRIFPWSFSIVAVLVLSNGVYPWAWLLLMRNGGLSSSDGPSKPRMVRTVPISPQKWDKVCARDNPERSKFELARGQLEKSKSRSGQ